mgnify:CR=1 FL=1
MQKQKQRSISLFAIALAFVVGGSISPLYTSSASATPAAFGPWSQLTGKNTGFSSEWSSLYPIMAGTANASPLWTAFSDELSFSDDKGATWEERTPADARHMYTVVASGDGGTVIATGSSSLFDDPVVYTSHDQGLTWTTFSSEGVYDIAIEALSADGSTAFISGTGDNGGVIFASTDDGSTWQEVTTDFDPNTSITLSGNGSKLFAIGSIEGSAMAPSVSTNGGVTWTQYTDGSVSDWRTPSMSTDGQVLVAEGYVDSDGEGWRIFVSTDGGSTWNKRDSESFVYGQHDTLVSADGSVIATIGYDEVGASIFTSTDAGLSWEAHALSDEETSNLQSLQLSASGSTIAVFADDALGNKTLFTTTNGGGSWRQYAPEYILTPQPAFISPDGNTLAVSTSYGGSGYQLHISTNGGDTWAQSVVSGKQSWYDIQSSAHGDILVASAPSYKTVLVSEDAGNSWQQRTPTGFDYIQSLTLSADGTTILVNGSDLSYENRLVISRDSGATWTELDIEGFSNPQVKAISSNGSTILIETSTYTMLSTDAGETWQQLAAQGSTKGALSANGRAIALVDTSGDVPHVLISTDHGVTWQERQVGPTQYSLDITLSADGRTLVAVGPDEEWRSVLYVSTDNGATWTARAESASTKSLTIAGNGKTLIIKEEDEDYTATYRISTDSGATWREIAINDTYIQSVLALSLDGNTIVVDGQPVDVNTRAVYISTNGGLDWERKSVPTGAQWTYEGIIFAASQDASHIYAMEFEGYVYGASQAVSEPTDSPLLFTPGASSEATSPQSTNFNAPQVITNTKPTFSGVAEPFSIVRVTVHSDPIICETVADANGQWSCTLPSVIPTGVHTVYVEITDPLTYETRTVGPYYIQINGSETTTIDTGTPTVPNTGFYTANSTVNKSYDAALGSGTFGALAAFAIVGTAALMRALWARAHQKN